MTVDRFTKLTFLVNGVSSLLGWNVVLACFDFFGSKFPGMQPATYFPIPLFTGYVVIVMLYNEMQKRVCYRNMILMGLIGTNLALTGMLLVALVMSESTIGYVIELLLCFCLGVCGNITQLSFFAMINYLSVETISNFNIGTALSMVLTSLTRIVILWIAGPNSSNIGAIIVYFAIGLLANFIDVYLNIRFFNGQVYQKMVKPHELNHQVDESQNPYPRKIAPSINGTVAKSPEMSYYKHLWEAHKEVFPCDLLILTNYIQTTPGAWSVCIIIMSYALGDTAGKAFCAKRKLFNEKSIIYTFFCRFYFFWTMIMLSKSWVKDPLLNSDAFAYINQLFFAFSNGIVTNGCFVLGFEKATDNNKRYAGLLLGMLIQVGIMTGTVLAIPTKLI